jgi:DnaJ-class molecular chaperone
MNNFYKTLGVSRSATEQQVKAADRALAKRLHPDVTPGDALAERRFKEIIRSYKQSSSPRAHCGAARSTAVRRGKV